MNNRCLNCDLGCLLVLSLPVLIPLLLIGGLINELSSLYYRISDWSMIGLKDKDGNSGTA